MDHQRVNIGTSQASCGILELSRLDSDTDDVLYAVASYLYHPSRGNPAAFIFWSDLPESNGQKFYDKVVSEDVWTSTFKSPKVENPKTGNIIHVYLWEIKHEAFKVWYKEQRIKRLKQG